MLEGGKQRALVNGDESSCLSVWDRGLAYGDGLFETLAIVDGRPCLWQGHRDRLLRGCERLRMPKPDTAQLLQEMTGLADGATGVGKIILTRGCSGRGYCPPAIVRANRILQFSTNFTLPEATNDAPIRALVCQTPLAINPLLAGIKHLNRLEQVMARMEWRDDGIAEGIVRDVEGYVIEGLSSNLFLVEQEQLLTPRLDRCGVEGVMRATVMAEANRQGLELLEERITLDRMMNADALFMTSSLTGIRAVGRIGDHLFHPDAIPNILKENVWKQSFMDYMQ